MMLQPVPLRVVEVVVGVGMIDKFAGNEEGPYEQAPEIIGNFVSAFSPGKHSHQV